VALAHDLGHTPFGHAGEHALSECLQPWGLDFEHNEQSYRIVTEIERVYAGFSGLNLSREVLEGLQKHETAWDHPRGGAGVKPSLEAQLVNLADEIAYQNHDVDDGLRSGLFDERDLEAVELWRRAHQKQIGDERIRQGRTVSAIIQLMVRDILEETERRLQASGVKTLEDVYKNSEPLVGFSDEMAAMNLELKNFLTNRLYFHPEVLRHSERGQATIRALFERLRGSMPPEDLRDYLSGMTDSFAEEQLENL
jgi:dGTPase